jgi:hypothetical protein
MAPNADIEQDGIMAPDGGPWQDASRWQERTRAAQDVGLPGSVTAAKTGSGNGHKPQHLPGEG